MQICRAESNDFEYFYFFSSRGIRESGEFKKKNIVQCIIIINSKKFHTLVRIEWIGQRGEEKDYREVTHTYVWMDGGKLKIRSFD